MSTHGEKSYVTAYEEFWKRLVEDDNGNLILDNIQRELADFHFMMREVASVYYHVTNGAMSKTNYMADSVIGVFNECREVEIRQAQGELLADLLGNNDEMDDVLRKTAEQLGLTSDLDAAVDSAKNYQEMRERLNVKED